MKLKVRSSSSRLVIINESHKYVVSNVEEESSAYWLTASAETTSEWEAGNYSYQIVNDTAIEDSGVFVIMQNYQLADETNYQSYWRGILDAVEATIAGRATNSQLQVHVGDKSLQYCSLNELLSLREFVAGKAAEEDEKQGKKTLNKNNQQTIKFQWK